MTVAYAPRGTTKPVLLHLDHHLIECLDVIKASTLQSRSSIVREFLKHMADSKLEELSQSIRKVDDHLETASALEDRFLLVQSRQKAKKETHNKRIDAEQPTQTTSWEDTY